jgi:hypothetical protein
MTRGFWTPEEPLDFFVHESEEALTLEIVLFNECTIRLTVWRTVVDTEDEPSVVIWRGNWCRNFTQFDFKTFSEWLAIAGEKNDVPAPRSQLELFPEERLRLGIVKRKPDNVVAFKPVLQRCNTATQKTPKDPPDGAA